MNRIGSPPVRSNPFHEDQNTMNRQPIETPLSDPASDIHRALESLQEEFEAIDLYNQRAEAAQDGELKEILVHNRDDEMEHAAMLLEWLRGAMPQLDAQLAKFLFKTRTSTETVDAPFTEPDSSNGLGAEEPR